ncbi:hypothetical protein FV232_04825 [Methylobacterium sp. WL30]|jgi:hypothetical protein|uniref:DUF6894 family protein n=1 Tax=unclassified Methylobacterium TaxID=2615210 RepID=UPI0011CA21F0|nr:MULTISPECIES: hypothetical protein [unclassified Methylobacterium]MCJ2038238.1 hypothetical protein [Methylobacterium sp. J-059]MCJ2079073.1 hypothetical protein [Methylobacterium sp. E-016]TXM95162.1 hypothetical protein FV223_01735 [Methylobacterium sp. WL116]TXN41024.1 hypothetical protein FV225_03960 [Methylobacterium sp. WL93]TXN49529.1 hypothetical protein FV227_16240 [Methylobacterium sp. WL119]
MPTPLYRFHCTDGHDLIADRLGKRLPTWALMRAHAERVVLDVMLGSTRRDWSTWTVEVYDGTGRHVLSKPFRDVLDNRPPRQG